MNGFLVVARCSADDVPLAMYETRDEAAAHAEAVSGGQVLQVAKVLMDASPANVVFCDIVEFSNGEPAGRERVKKF